MARLRYTGERPIPSQTDDQGVYNLFVRHLARYKFAGQHLRAHDSVLDAGCGTGYGTDLLAGLTDGRVIGIDISEDAIAYARANYGRENLKFLIMDCAYLDFEDHFFDLVCAIETIEHVQDYARFLKEVRRVLKDGGRCVLSTPNASYGAELGWLQSRFHVQEFGYSELRGALREIFPDVKILGERVLNPGVAKYHDDVYCSWHRTPRLPRRVLRSVTPEFVLRFARKRLLGEEPKLDIDEVVFSEDEAVLAACQIFLAVCRK